VAAGRCRLQTAWSGMARNHMAIDSKGRTKATGIDSANASTGSSDDPSDQR